MPTAASDKAARQQHIRTLACRHPCSRQQPHITAPENQPRQHWCNSGVVEQLPAAGSTTWHNVRPRGPGQFCRIPCYGQQRQQLHVNAGLCGVNCWRLRTCNAADSNELQKYTRHSTAQACRMHTCMRPTLPCFQHAPICAACTAQARAAHQHKYTYIAMHTHASLSNPYQRLRSARPFMRKI